MHPLPEALPSSVPPRKPTAYLGWLGRHQWVSILIGTTLDTVWLCTLAFAPWVIGRTIDEGVATGDLTRLLLWAGVLLGIEVVHSVVEGLRDRAGVVNWTRATYRSIGLVSRHVARAGFAMSKRLSTGEVSATVTGDAMGIAYLSFMVGAFIAALLSYGIVGTILLSSSIPLGLLVLVGVPLSSAMFFAVVRPLRARQNEQRAAIGRMTSLAADTVTGLRVLRGAGGEQMFVERYRRVSEETRASGVRLATPLGVIDGIQVLIPGSFIVALTWIGATLVAAGDLTPGQLVSFYGYAGFLVMPIQVAADSVSIFTRAQVGAKHVLAALAVEPLTTDSRKTSEVEVSLQDLTDQTSGVRLRAGLLTALASDDPVEANALLDRLARLDDSAPGAGGASLGRDALVLLSVSDVRARIVRVDADPYLFDGTLRAAVSPGGRDSDDRIRAAIWAASADDVLDALPEGLATRIGERGRRISGGQRQRVGLARALATDCDWLLLETPTSAVDSHTEAVIARRLVQARAGRSTVVVTTSPPLLSEADEVHLIRNGRVVASGTHHELLERNAEYVALVRRAEAEA